MKLPAFGIAVAALMAHSAWAATFTFETFSYPGAVFGTRAYDINNSGQVVGSYDGLGGFTWHAGGFQSFENPGASWTVPFGLNDSGRIVGAYDSSGFIFDNGSFRNAPVEGDILVSGLRSASNTGWLAGSYTISGFGTWGYTQSPSGEFDSFMLGGGNATVANGVNDEGIVVGLAFSWNSVPQTRGFIRRGGSTTLVAYPGAMSTEFNGINNAGLIVGHARNCYECPSRSFLYRSGAFDFIVPPSGTQSLLVHGINDLGQIAGSAVGSDGVERGFVGTPSEVPEPGTLALMLPAALLLGIARARARWLQRNAHGR